MFQGHQMEVHYILKVLVSDFHSIQILFIEHTSGYIFYSFDC